MAISTYRYASVRQQGEGIRIGTARFVPRGVRREDWQLKGYFDVRLPLLSPEPEFIKEFRSGRMTFASFSRRYRGSMRQKESRQVIELLAQISRFLPISLGCDCEDESRCHRSILQRLITTEAERRRLGSETLRTVANSAGLLRFASPVCFSNWEDEA